MSLQPTKFMRSGWCMWQINSKWFRTFVDFFEVSWNFVDADAHFVVNNFLFLWMLFSVSPKIELAQAGCKKLTLHCPVLWGKPLIFLHPTWFSSRHQFFSACTDHLSNIIKHTAIQKGIRHDLDIFLCCFSWPVTKRRVLPNTDVVHNRSGRDKSDIKWSDHQSAESINTRRCLLVSPQSFYASFSCVIKPEISQSAAFICFSEMYPRFWPTFQPKLMFMSARKHSTLTSLWLPEWETTRQLILSCTLKINKSSSPPISASSLSSKCIDCFAPKFELVSSAKTKCQNWCLRHLQQETKTTDSGKGVCVWENQRLWFWQTKTGLEELPHWCFVFWHGIHLQSMPSSSFGLNAKTKQVHLLLSRKEPFFFPCRSFAKRWAKGLGHFGWWYQPQWSPSGDDTFTAKSPCGKKRNGETLAVKQVCFVSVHMSYEDSQFLGDATRKALHRICVFAYARRTKWQRQVSDRLFFFHAFTGICRKHLNGQEKRRSKRHFLSKGLSEETSDWRILAGFRSVTHLLSTIVQCQRTFQSCILHVDIIDKDPSLLCSTVSVPFIRQAISPWGLCVEKHEATSHEWIKRGDIASAAGTTQRISSGCQTRGRISPCTKNRQLNCCLCDLEQTGCTFLQIYISRKAEENVKKRQYSQVLGELNRKSMDWFLWNAQLRDIPSFIMTSKHGGGCVKESFIISKQFTKWPVLPRKTKLRR